MIVVTLDEIEDFIAILERRISEYIFFEFIRCDFDGLRVLLNFLGTLGNQTVVLFQTNLDFPGIKDKKAVINKIKEMDTEKLQLNLKFIPGTLREIYLSIS